jgi:hypothetical protein
MFLSVLAGLRPRRLCCAWMLLFADNWFLVVVPYQASVFFG